MLLALILSVTISNAYLIAYKIGMHSRITLSAAIYQKILSLSQVTIGRLSVGHVVNLASNDVHRLDMVSCVHVLHSCFIMNYAYHNILCCYRYSFSARLFGLLLLLWQSSHTLFTLNLAGVHS